MCAPRTFAKFIKYTSEDMQIRETVCERATGSTLDVESEASSMTRHDQVATSKIDSQYFINISVQLNIPFSSRANPVRSGHLAVTGSPTAACNGDENEARSGNRKDRRLSIRESCRSSMSNYFESLDEVKRTTRGASLGVEWFSLVGRWQGAKVGGYDSCRFLSRLFV